MNVSMLWNHGSKYTPKSLNYYFISQKASASGRLWPQTPYHASYFSNIEQFPDIEYLISISHEGSWTWSRTMMHVVIYFKCLPHICTKINGLKFDFLKISAESLTEPPSQTHPRFFSDFALSFGFAFNSQTRRAFDLGVTLNFRLENLICPQNEFLDQLHSRATEHGATQLSVLNPFWHSLCNMACTLSFIYFKHSSHSYHNRQSIT